MKYISGTHALNLPCLLETGGDWHASGLQWSNIKLFDSDNMFFKEYGIESNRTLPGKPNSEKYNVANHIRAILDLLELGQFTIAQGMNNDYICNNKYDDEVFLKVYSMNKLQNWNQIDAFMKREYRSKWLDFKEKNERKKQIY